MNADFERDPSAYPIGAQYIGHGWKIVDVPTQRILLDTYLPIRVASRAAAMLNAKGGKRTPASHEVAQVVSDVAGAIFAEGDITGATLDHIRVNLRTFVN